MDEETIPQTRSRPDYGQLKNSVASQPAPEQARQKMSRPDGQADAHNSPNFLILLLQLIAALTKGEPLGNSFSSGSNLAMLSDFRNRFTSADLENRQLFVAPRETENVTYAAEIPGGITGITKEDSYLFITTDYADGKTEKYRAYVVPKSDPSKQHEITMTDVHSPTEVHRFLLTAKLGDRHQFVAAGDGDTLDGNSLKVIGGHYRDGELNQHEIDRLVKQRAMVGNALPAVSGTIGDNPVCGEFDGDKWVFRQKDIRSGRILKFTQSDKDPTKGTLEVIQGDAVSAAREAGMSRWTVGTQQEQRDRDEVYQQVRKEWLTNGETKRAPISSPGNLVSMPESMKIQDVLFDTANARADMALEKIIGDPGAIEKQIKEKNHEQTARDNGQNDAARSQRQPNFPKP